MPLIESGTYAGTASRVQQVFWFDRQQTKLVVTNNSATEKIVVAVADAEKTIFPSESYTFDEEFKSFNVKTKSKINTASFTAISSGSVSEVKAATTNVANVIEPTNWFDYNGRTAEYLNADTGEIVISANYSTSNCIPVDNGDTITIYGSLLTPISVISFIALDKDKNFIPGSGLKSKSSFVVSDPNIKFVRFCNSNTYINANIQAIKGTTAPTSITSYFQPYKEIRDKATRLVEPINWFNYNEITAEYLNGDTGAITTAATYSTSEPIPVNNGDVITVYSSSLNPLVVSSFCGFDKDKNFVVGSGVKNVSSYMVNNADIKYVRFCHTNTYIGDLLQVIKGTVAPKLFNPYFKPYYADILDKSKELFRASFSKSNSDNADQYNSLPRIDFEGDITGMNGDDKKTLKFTYIGSANYYYTTRESRNKFTGYAKVKWQGSSSMLYPKKNYSLSLYTDEDCTTKNDITFVTSWGAHAKYVLKANFVDVSQSRNIVACKLWGQMVKSRNNTSLSYTKLKDLPNGGAIDGKPTRVYFNGEYAGLYTLNLPKDGYTYGMTGGATEVLLGAETHSTGTRFESAALIDDTDFAYEYDPDDVSWVPASFNAIYNALQLPSTTAGEITAKKTALEACVDIDSVIDYMIFITLICAADNLDKNWLMGTFDGIKWFISAYDCDGTFGNSMFGTGYYSRTDQQYAYTNGTQLFEAIKNLYTTELKARYTAVRASVFHIGNLQWLFSNFMADIPLKLIEREAEMYPLIPGTATNNVAQIMNYMSDRFTLIDTIINELT